MNSVRFVDPGDLRLSTGRQDGAKRSKYLQQVQQFGAEITDMPPIEVTEGRDGELMINDGVTRATRCHYLAPGELVPVDVIDVRTFADFSRLLRVRDVPPPR
ncbi:MAG: hypothetical protein IAG10_04480 [Planctomycetaceae bacterium]|nr:hypothetical protein [Planctomycetaceae bacterium]